MITSSEKSRLSRETNLTTRTGKERIRNLFDVKVFQLGGVGGLGGTVNMG